VSSFISNLNDGLFHVGDPQTNAAPTKVVDRRTVTIPGEQIVPTTEVSYIGVVQQASEIPDSSAVSVSIDKPQPLLPNQEDINPKDTETRILTDPVIVPGFDCIKVQSLPRKLATASPELDCIKVELGPQDCIVVRTDVCYFFNMD
jgi:hypothetical protein